MKRKKSKPLRKQTLDPLAFMHQPHDKYARFVLQNRAVALELIQFGLSKYWNKVIIFAPELRAENSHLELFQATVIYVSRISTVFNENIENMDSVLSSAEVSIVKPYVIKLYEDGVAKGIEKGTETGFAKAILKFIKKNPDWTDRQVAQAFDVEEDMVKKLRISIK